MGAARRIISRACTLRTNFGARFLRSLRESHFTATTTGLDAYFIDPEAKNLYLYQFKWSENHNLFKDSLDRLAKDGMNRIFGNPMGDPAANELLNWLRRAARVPISDQACSRPFCF